MNEDGLCVTTQPVYIYFNRYSGEEEEAEEDKSRQKASLNVHVKLSSGPMPSVSGWVILAKGERRDGGRESVRFRHFP